MNVRARRIPRLPAFVFLAAVFALMPLALLGQRTYVAVDMKLYGSPARDVAHLTEPANGVQSDVQEFQGWVASFWRDLRHGTYQKWSPYNSGGVPTGTTSIFGTHSPTNLPYLVLPAWYAATLRAALYLLTAQVGCYLLARRLGVSQRAATVAGVAYGFCGANMVFLHRVGAAAVAPLVLWAGHRLFTSPTARNVIARAAGAGIRLEASDDGRFVQNNLIGPPTGGNLAFRNGIGITVVGSFRDVITKNLIDNSVTQGVRILASATPAQQTTISDNDIGISPAFNDAGNGTNGIRIEGGSGHSVVFNKIVNNGTDGLVVLTASRKVRFANNSIANNALQAIDLSPDGVNPIDLDVDATGANDQQNYPTLTYAGGTSDAGTVSGLLESANGTYLIQFFRSSTCDANGYGEAETWIGQTSATISNAGPFSNGGMGFTGDVVSPSGSNIGAYITAIATDEEGNSSEMSACIPYQETAIFADGFE